ncbi:MAG: glycoside hydrolase family 127 protein [Pirellulales bacterium]|nr:glycoside hydrolase family 127 protein [Pirellulales bacterium]
MRAQRKLVTFSLALVAVVSLTAFAADPLTYDNTKMKAANRVPLRVYSFDLPDVRLLDGPFKHAQELDRQYLLSLDTDRLLHTFRINAGLSSSAEPLGGWEKPDCELRGHFTGHYLTACAMMVASTKDPALKAKADAVVDGLAECQAKFPNGYLSAYPEEFFDRVESGQRVWAPYYTLHKIYAGLLDMYVYCDNAQALAVCKKFADWAIARNDRLSDERMQRMLDIEHGGMNEVLANLYGLTGEEKYLKIAQRFNHMAVIGPAQQRQDKLTGLHANTQIPKFIGAAKQYELTADPRLKTAAEFFWETVVHERSYVIGGHSNGEHFSPKEKLSEALGPATTETCNTYNMLKLTRHLFCWEPDAKYADYYERALYNHILASQHPETGMMCYYVPLRSGSAKQGDGYGYSSPLDSFWCCTGTGIENHAKYGDSIYFHDGKETLIVNLYIASELRIPETDMIVRQETRFPEEDTTRLILTCKEPKEGTLKIRHPAWAASGIEMTVNGVRQDTESRPGSYVTLRRQWENNDRVEVKLPMRLSTEGFRDNPDRFAFLNGPLVLCAEVDRTKPFPAVVASHEEAVAALAPAGDRSNVFLSEPGLFRIPGSTGPVRVRLEPFYQMHGERPYVVYWDRFSSHQWQAKEEEYRAEQVRQTEIAERTVDMVSPGEQQSETDHGLQGERTSSGDFGGRKYRHAQDGWFSYRLKILPGQPQELWVTYWGSDSGNRTFDVLVDGERLISQRLQRKHPDTFYDEITPLPENMTKGKQSITIKFQAHSGNWAGGVFGLRTMRSK